jgi:hypothetical protein
MPLISLKRSSIYQEDKGEPQSRKKYGSLGARRKKETMNQQ